MSTPHVYSLLEERINIASHAAGFFCSLGALALLVWRAGRFGNAVDVVSAGIFGASLVALYAASTAYHSASRPSARARLRVIDHATIYLLIAGTYTPFTLITLKGTVGWVIFGVSWGLAALGVYLKIHFTGRFDKLSTVMYVAMGWIIIFAAEPLMERLAPAGLYWIVAGGLSYTLGAVIYSIRRIPMNHAIFHGFVLGGSLCHFMAVYFYVLPGYPVD
jgi:hemolysin III